MLIIHSLLGVLNFSYRYYLVSEGDYCMHYVNVYYVSDADIEITPL